MSRFTRKLIGMMYENNSTKRNMYRYQGPSNPFIHIMTKANPITAQNKTFVSPLISMSRRPIFERGEELFMTLLVSHPV